MNDVTSPCCGAEFVHEHDRTTIAGCAACGAVWDVQIVGHVMAVPSAGTEHVWVQEAVGKESVTACRVCGQRMSKSLNAPCPGPGTEATRQGGPRSPASDETPGGALTAEPVSSGAPASAPDAGVQEVGPRIGIRCVGVGPHTGCTFSGCECSCHNVGLDTTEPRAGGSATSREHASGSPTELLHPPEKGGAASCPYGHAETMTVEVCSHCRQLVGLAEPTPSAEPDKRIVGWVRYDGDEWHDFTYQTEMPSMALIRARTKNGWFPVYVEEPVVPQGYSE